MSDAINDNKHTDYQAMQKRRRDGLRWDKGSTILLTSALSLLLFAFAFYDRPITDNSQILSFLRGEQTTGVH